MGHRPTIVIIENEYSKKTQEDASLSEKLPHMFLRTDEAYSDEALRSFLQSEKKPTESKQRLLFSLLTLDNAGAINQAHERLETSERFIQTFARAREVHELVPNKVYFKILQEGTGSSYSHPDQVQLHCKIWKLSDDSFDNRLLPGKTMDVSSFELIPGLCYALNGMRKDETREVYIHPDYAYGCQSNFPPATGLRVEVTLLAVESTSHTSKQVTPFDDCHKQLPPKVSELELQHLKTDAAKAEGKLLKILSGEHKILSDFFYKGNK